MKGCARLLPLLVAAACSGLEEGEGGVVAIEVETPERQTLAVGEQVQVVARAVDVDGGRKTPSSMASWAKPEREHTQQTPLRGAGSFYEGAPGLDRVSSKPRNLPDAAARACA